MKAKAIFFAAIIAVLSMGFTSCKKDKEDPTIDIIEPDDGATLAWGEEIHVELNFNDDRDLKHYSIMIGDAAGVLDTNFNFSYAEDISGTTHYFHEHAIVPDSCSSTIIYIYYNVEDAEGKTAAKTLTLHITP